jgi:uncharacterized protein
MVSQETADGQSAANPEGGRPDERRPDRAAASPRLMVDAMLGRLAKWLRLAGYDAEYWREGSDDELMVAAREQGRLILTKDRGLAGRRGVKALLLHAEDLDAQIEEAREGLGRWGPVPEPFTHCAECNGLLVGLPHEDAQGLVPPYVWHTQREFRRCTRCGRVYWKGTHWPAVQGRLAEPGAGGMEGEGA